MVIVKNSNTEISIKERESSSMIPHPTTAANGWVNTGAEAFALGLGKVV